LFIFAVHFLYIVCFDKPNKILVFLKTFQNKGIEGKTSYKQVWKKTLTIDNHLIEVVFFEDEEVFSITDAWIKN